MSTPQRAVVLLGCVPRQVSNGYVTDANSRPFLKAAPFPIADTTAVDTGSKNKP